MIPGPESPALDFLKQKQHMIIKLRENLTQAQQRMKKYADLKRSERVFVVGDMSTLSSNHIGNIHLTCLSTLS
jgi:hypothetical protein